MGTLINLAVKFSGLGWIWEKFDGAKTYIAAAVAILTGLLGLIQEFQPLLVAHDAGGVWALFKALPHDNSWLMLVGGLGTLGLGHRIGKVGAAQEAAQIAAPPVPLNWLFEKPTTA